MTQTYFLEPQQHSRSPNTTKSYQPTEYERTSELLHMHHSDGGVTEVLHTIPKEDQDRLPVIMVAGFITILDSWEVVLQGLKDSFEIYYWETREKGTFHPPDRLNKSHFTPERFTQDLVELIEATGVGDGKYILIGSSFGGTIMIDALAEHRIYPYASILVGANTHFRIPFPGNILVKILPPFMLTWFKPMIKWYLRTFSVDRKTDEKQYQKYAKAVDLANFNFIKKTVVNYHPHPQEDILENIQSRTIVVGAELDKMHTIEETKMTADRIPNAEIAPFKTNNDTHSEPFVKWLLDTFN